MPITCKLCGKVFPFRVKIDGKIHNLNNRKYCLDCSPFGKHNTRRLEYPPMAAPLGHKNCSKCNVTKPESEYYKKKNGKLVSWCKECYIEYQKARVLEKQRRLKRDAVLYKGGECEQCGYSKYYGALDFHHVNPEEKLFAIARIIRDGLTDEVKEELAKCQLLCSNCHREIHASVT